MTESGLFKHPLSGGDLLDSRFEKLTLPLRSRAHLRDYGSYEHPMLRHRLNDAAWGLDRPLPAGSPVGGGRPRTTDLRAVLNAIFYLLRTGCQWRQLARPASPRAQAPTSGQNAG